MINNIQIDTCDNELILIAYPEGHGTSYTIGTIVSGCNYAVDVSIPITSGPYFQPVTINGLAGPMESKVVCPMRLPPATYYLVGIGINWGDDNPHGFEFNFNSKSHTSDPSPPNPGSGVVWSTKPIRFIVGD